MNHYLYKILDTQTNQYYLGKRSCPEEPSLDSYMGSGLWIRKLEKTFGPRVRYAPKGRFIKIIIEYCGSSKEAYHREAVVVDETILRDPLCMN